MPVVSSPCHPHVFEAGPPLTTTFHRMHCVTRTIRQRPASREIVIGGAVRRQRVHLEPSQNAASALSGPEPIDIHCPVGPIRHARLSG